MSEPTKFGDFIAALTSVILPFIAFIGGYFIPFYAGKALAMSPVSQLGLAVTMAFTAPAIMAMACFLWGLILRIKSRPLGESYHLYLIASYSSVTSFVVLSVYEVLLISKELEIIMSPLANTLFLWSKIFSFILGLIGICSLCRLMCSTRAAKTALFIWAFAFVAIITMLQKTHGFLDRLL